MMVALRYSLRLIRRSPLFASAVILTLALAIAGNAVIFSVIDCVLIRPLPYDHSGQIVRLFETFPVSAGQGFGSASAPDFLDWRSQARTFNGLAAYSVQSRNLTQTDRPAALIAASVSEDFFKIFGVAARLGRTFRREDISNDEGLAVLSEAFWQEHFGRDPGVIGSKFCWTASPMTSSA